MSTQIKTMFIQLMLLLMLGCSTTSFSATYYVDYGSGSDSYNGTSTSTPWKHAPGMSGWTGSATLSSGDTVILKGGVTWTFTSKTADLWTPPVSGLTIEGGQRLGTPWGTGYPILDGTGTTGSRAGLYISGKSNITIDGIKIYNTELSPSGSSGIKLFGVTTNFELKNSTLDHTGDQSLQIGPSNGSSHILIHDNIFSNSGRLFMSVDDGNTVDDTQIYNNTFNGPGSWPGGYHGVHGDGIMIGSACTAANTCLTNLKIHHNIFKGDWASGATALLYLNNGTGVGTSLYGGNHVQIYDNQLAIDTDGVISALVWVAVAWNDVKIYNNTFGSYYSGSNPIATCLAVSSTATNIDIKNNIFSGCTNTAINATSTSITSIDYNIYSPEIVRMINGWTGSADCRSQASCYSSFGQEQHGLKADPIFVQRPNGTPGHGNWTLQSSSPAIDKGINLSALFTDDLLGNTRAVTWDIGAYKK
jgi:hypothetical protein